MNQDYLVSESKVRKLLWLFFLLHFVVWVFMPAIMRCNLPFDSAEGIAWGHVWALGYDKHPLLAPWLTAGITDLFGVVGWPVYLISQISVLLCFWSVWRVASAMLPAIQALVSVMLLEGVYYYNIASEQFNPNVLMLSMWGVTAMSFDFASLRGGKLRWVCVGVFAGLAMITKYESAILLMALFSFTLINDQARSHYKSGHILYALVAFCFVCLPNFIWLVQHHFLPLLYTEGRLNNDHYPYGLDHVFHPGMYVIEQAGAIFPVFIYFLPFFFCDRECHSVGSFNKLFLWTVGAGPFLIILVYSILAGAWINSLWAFPIFSFVGVMLISWYKPIMNEVSLHRFFLLFLILFGITWIARAIAFWTGPYLSHQGNASIFPGKLLSARVMEIWHTHYASPLPFIAGQRTLVSNAAAYSKDKPAPFYAWKLEESPWIKNEDAVRKEGAVFIWTEKDDSKISILPPEIAKRFPTAKVQPVIVLPHLTHAKMDDFHLGAALLPPQSNKK